MRTSIALAGVLAAGLAATALGDETDGTAGGVTYRSDSAPIGPPDSVELDVSCPASKHASGSGFGTVSTVAGPVDRSVPVDGGDQDSRPDDGWELLRRDEPGFPAGTSIVHAMCDSKTRTYRTRTLPAPDGETRTAKVKCPRSQHVSGGGAALLGQPIYGEIESTYPFDSGDRGGKPDDGWAVRFSNLDHSPHQMKAFAVCASAGLAYRKKELPLLGGGYGGFTPGCGNRHLVGLGARISSAPGNSVLENLHPADDNDAGSVPDDYAVGDGSSDAASGTMTVFTVCR